MTCVKICGITNLEDALVAAEAGADLLGFILYPPSPRYIKPEQVQEISRALHRTSLKGRRSGNCKTVGVFVNEAPHRIYVMAKQCELDLIQLSGDEAPEMLSQIGACGYKALRPRSVSEIQGLMETYHQAVRGKTPAFILDAFDARRYGGTGQPADWAIAGEVARRYPILLAGGLTADNVATAVETVRPWGVDVSSGVERAPGLKDQAKVKAFIAAVKRDG